MPFEKYRNQLKLLDLSVWEKTRAQAPRGSSILKVLLDMKVTS
jgi:hypothetical protein